jgi:hypothetical protein
MKTSREAERSGSQTSPAGTSLPQFVTIVGRGRALPWTTTARAVEVDEILNQG